MANAVRRYKVLETRQIVVDAPSPSDAVKEAAEWLNIGGPGGADGMPEILVTTITVMEE